MREKAVVNRSDQRVDVKGPSNACHGFPNDQLTSGQREADDDSAGRRPASGPAMATGRWWSVISRQMRPESDSIPGRQVQLSETTGSFLTH